MLKRLLLAAIAAVSLIVLSGCYHVDGSLTVNADKTISGEVNVGLPKTVAKKTQDKFFTSLKLNKIKGVKVSNWKDDSGEFSGKTITLINVDKKIYESKFPFISIKETNGNYVIKGSNFTIEKLPGYVSPEQKAKAEAKKQAKADAAKKKKSKKSSKKPKIIKKEKPKLPEPKKKNESDKKTKDANAPKHEWNVSITFPDKVIPNPHSSGVTVDKENPNKVTITNKALDKSEGKIAIKTGAKGSLAASSETLPEFGEVTHTDSIDPFPIQSTPQNTLLLKIFALLAIAGFAAAAYGHLGSGKLLQKKEKK